MPLYFYITPTTTSLTLYWALPFHSFLHLFSSFVMSPSLHPYLLSLDSLCPTWVLLPEMEDDYGGDGDDDNNHRR